MKKSISIIILIFLSLTCYSQNRDNVWMLGYNVGGNNDRCGIDFTMGIPDTFSVESSMEFFVTNASICDNSGNLLFHTNGNYIANRNHDTLLNSMNFNPGWLTDSSGAFALPMCQGVIVLPHQMIHYGFMFYMKLVVRRCLIICLAIRILIMTLNLFI